MKKWQMDLGFANVVFWLKNHLGPGLTKASTAQEISQQENIHLRGAFMGVLLEFRLWDSNQLALLHGQVTSSRSAK